MTSTIKKTLSSFLAVCMLFGLFIVLDQPITVNAAEALSNVSTISATSVQKGQSVQVNAIAKGGTGFYQYAAYSKLSTDAAWTTEQGYGANSIIMISFSASGSYDVRVTIKDSNGEVATKDFAVSVGASAGLANKSTLSATSIALGSSITVNAKAEGGTAPYLYGVYYKKASAEKWSTAQGYKSNDTISIKPSAATTYNVKVKVKDSAGKIVAKSFTVNVTKALSNTASISSELISLGQSVTVTCAATGGKTPYLFGVYYKLTTVDNFTTVQAYNANKTVAITPKKVGTYDIKVKVKDAANKIVSKSFKLSVVGSSALTNTSSLSATKITLGNPITVNASATGGSAPYQYALYYRSAEVTTWKAIQSYKTNSTIQYKPTLAGKYELCIKVKDSKGTIVKKYVDFTAETNIVNTTTMSADTISTNDNLTFKCSATGGTDSYQYAVYMKKAEETEYITYRAFSTNTTEVMTFSDPGNYDLCVKVKDSNGAIVKKYFKLTVTGGNTGTKYDIVYYVDLNDSYLQKLDIENPNENFYYSGEGLVLQDLIVDGYYFLGWYTAQNGGNIVTEITKGTTGRKILYAHWELVQYKITFDSPDVPVDSIYYTVDTGATLKKPSIGGYTFVGWSKDGKVINSIPKGTTGNITLHANWTSNRNRAEAVSKLDTPSIIEDYDNGAILFVYEIGTIHNIPLSRIDVGENEIVGPTDGLDLTKVYKYSTMVDEGYAQTVANTISNATTKSSEWTLSEDWNTTTQATNECEEGISKTKETTDIYGNTIGSRYYIGNSEGGYTSSTTNNGGSKSTSSKVTLNDSVGISGSYTHQTEWGDSVKLSNGFQLIPQVGVDIADMFGVSIGGMGVWEDYEHNIYHKDADTFNLATSRETGIGVEVDKNQESHWDKNTETQNNWNSEKSYEKSSSVSQSQSLSNVISDVIYNRWQYSSMESRGGNNSETQSTGESQELKDEYASTVEYSTETKEEIETTQNIHRNETGYYRLINAGTAHVFAVVGYDIATNSYFTYTYNVLDKERHIFVDYSMSTALFNDCENGILSFEVPIEVSTCVEKYIAGTKGFSVDDNGIISEKYTGDADITIVDEDGIIKYITGALDVVIPQYMSIKNTNNTYSAVRVHGFTSNVFRGNKNIKAVYLPKYVTEIPDNAFEGCSSLECVVGYGITKIGSNAFKDCTSLKKFSVDEHVTFIGINAFKNVTEIEITAGNADVAMSTIQSGAKRISLDISKMDSPESFKNKIITVDSSTEFFHIMSDNTAYNNISIKSEATETRISNMIFKNNTKAPMDINSSKVLLGQVKVDNCSGLALILRADSTTLDLFGKVELNSSADYTAISKNVTLTKNDPTFTSLLQTNGLYCLCGEMINPDLFNGTVKRISDNEFNAILTSCTVSFNPNGGTVTATSQQAYYGQTYGTLPTPTRGNYNFDGWFTAASGGTQVTSDTTVTAMANHTLYAHWSPKKYTVYFNGNGGTAYSSSKMVTYNTTYGTLPSAQRDYYDFTGWYTAASGGTRIYDSTVFTGTSDVTLYAHWNVHSVSGWVEEGSVPYGAKIVEQKWKYTYTTYSERWEWTGGGTHYYGDFPAEYNTSDRYYWMNGSEWSSYNNGSTKRDVGSPQFNSYVFWHWASPWYTGDGNHLMGRYYNEHITANGANRGYATEWESFESTSPGDNVYNDGSYVYKGMSNYSWHWFRITIYRQDYNEYKKVVDSSSEERESYSYVSAGNNISNVRRYVKYQAK